MTLKNTYPIAGLVSSANVLIVMPLDDIVFMQTYAPRNKPVNAFGRSWMVTGDGTVYATDGKMAGKYPVFSRVVTED